MNNTMNTVPTHIDKFPVYHPGHNYRPGSAVEEFKESRDRLISEFLEGGLTGAFQEDYSEIMDLYFRMTVQESMTGQALFKKRTPFALVAVGGYGRKDLCIHSDIDILILFNKKIPPQAKSLSEELFFPLWDAGLELGYGVRTIKDCLSLSKDDFEVLTSLMNIRFICGDSLLYLDLTEALGKKVLKKSVSSFIKWLNQEEKTRMEAFGDASHLLEPNLKEGIGGLRDYHHILWMAKAFLDVRQPRDLEPLGKFSSGEYNDLRECVRFIHLVRNHLHQLSGRKNDRLNFEYQETIAKRLGYKNLPKFPAVEQFLSRLHSCMESVKTLHRCFISMHAPRKHGALKDSEPKEIAPGIQQLNDELHFKSIKFIENDPFVLMDIFAQSSRLGLPLGLDAIRNAKEFLNLVDDGFRRSPRVVEGFLNIINSRHTAGTLDQMFETGLLDAFIPEFGEIKDRVQFDAYHIFPVGRHVLETVAYLKNLSKEKNLLLASTYADIKNHERLFLSGLFHDIGKNGKSHARRGVHIARTILERMGYPEEGIEEITFQIAHHLILAEIATRRDLDDEKVIIQVARTIGDINRLKMLYLLTWADSRATGPRAWNDWTANLVQDLFFKALHILERGELATPDSAQRIAKLKSKLKRKTGEGISHEDFERLYENMPTRYKLSTSPADIANHMDMCLRFEKEIKKNPGAFILNTNENKPEEYWQVSFVGRDRPGLFSDLAGVMALNNINILSSNIYTWRDGTAVDIFYVTSPLDPIHSRATWKKIKSDLENTFSGKISLSQQLNRKAAPSILSTPGKPSLPPDVVIDNDASDFFTLIEVFASDRIGLLHLITRTLFDLHLDIRIAKIGVKSDQIADVFYVRDLDGQKIEDEQQVSEIKRVLLHHLSTDYNSLGDVRL
jgi:[protein-PII] uridylyltransferase